KYPLRQLRFVGGISNMGPRRGSNSSPLLGEVFEEADVPFAHEETQEILLGVTGDYARLDDDRDPSLGVHGRMELRYAHGLGQGDPNYNQWHLEARGYLPVFAKRRVIAVRAVYTGVDPVEEQPDAIPFYRLAISEGQNRFAGYPSQRFRDRQLMTGRIEYRWVIWRRLTAAALYEVGQVAPGWDHFQARDVHISYGGGLRLGLSAISAFRFDVANGSEGVNVILRFGSSIL
ncbi:MAG TPA: BamA/TamA family outer membrane protein, partial [bacterium]|nr:BamA/TamA family outer membrane protein [bacterium]